LSAKRVGREQDYEQAHTPAPPKREKYFCLSDVNISLLKHKFRVVFAQIKRENDSDIVLRSVLAGVMVRALQRGDTLVSLSS